MCKRKYSLVTVVVAFVVAAKSRKTSQTNAIREEDLSPSVHPHLQKREKERERHSLGFTLSILLKIPLYTLSLAFYKQPQE